MWSDWRRRVRKKKGRVTKRRELYKIESEVKVEDKVRFDWMYKKTLNENAKGIGVRRTIKHFGS